MKVSVHQNALKRAITLVSHAIASKPVLPVLSNIKFFAQGDVLTLQSTNLEMAITYTITCNVEVMGETTLPSKLLSDLVSNLPSSIVSLSTSYKSQMTEISSGKSVASINGLESDDYPEIPNTNTMTEIGAIPVIDFRNAINQVIIAAAGDDSRPVLAGVFMKIPNIATPSANTISLNAADGFRLAIRSIEFSRRNESFSDAEYSVIIPAKSMQEVSRILALAEGDVVMSANSNNVGFTVNHNDGGTIQFATRIIEGNYPQITSIVPTEFLTTITVATAELAKAIKIAKLFSAASNNVVRLSFDPATGIEIRANGDGKGHNVTNVDAEIEGLETFISLNALFLEEALSVMATEKITIRLNTKDKPALITPFEWSLYRHIIMPMMVR